MPLTRRLILQKARHHPNKEALTDCRRTVSGTISLPSRGTFHHSLTVLVRYRSPGSIQPYQVVLADSQQILGVRCYSGIFTKRPEIFAYGALTLYGRLSHTVQLTFGFVTLQMTVRSPTGNPTTPDTQPLTGSTRIWFRLDPLSLATTHGITCCLLFLRVLRCFTSPRSPQPAYVFNWR